MSLHELNRLDPVTFEHLATSLALRELGGGVTTFGPGPDGGRDAYFEGKAPYPSQSNKWSGTWYIQAKYHAPHLTANAQRWLVSQVRKEIEQFKRADAVRIWPDNWIIITNVDQTAVPQGGSFDQIQELVRDARPALAGHFHIRGGRKMLDLLNRHQDVASRYGDFLTAGHVLTALHEHVKAERASVELITYHLIVRRMEEQQYAKLEQAGSQEYRPGIHRLYTDVPFAARDYDLTDRATAQMHVASRKSHTPDTDVLQRSPRSTKWRHHPSRSRIWFIRGGPGQGKSTITQYFAQVQRAWFVLEGGVRADTKHRTLAEEIRESAEELSIWPNVGRIPVMVELKDFAKWSSS